MKAQFAAAPEAPRRRRPGREGKRCGFLDLLAAAILLSAFPTWAGAGAADNAKTGPTIHLDYGRGQKAGNSVAAFMYFIPLISPEPVAAQSSPGSTQQARVTSATRRDSGTSFSTVCDFEFTGEGSQQDVFDLTRQIQRHKQQLKMGRTLGRQLRSITVTGSGRGRVKVTGTLTNGVATVTEVRLRFNAQGRTSPVSIGLCDVRYQDGDFRRVNELVARVNTLTFRRAAGPPRMEVTVASVKKKGAGNGLWQNLKGRLESAAVNLFIDPLTVQAVGHRAMLDFGQALATGAGSFTFPRAVNLIQTRH